MDFIMQNLLEWKCFVWRKPMVCWLVGVLKIDVQITLFVHSSTPPQGGPRTAAQSSGAQAEQGGTPAQGRRRAQAYPCPPDLRGKYIICYIEGQDVPQPSPDKDTVIFKITADGTQQFECYYPFSRWIEGNAIVETFWVARTTSMPEGRCNRWEVRAGTGAPAHFSPPDLPQPLPPGSVAPLQDWGMR